MNKHIFQIIASALCLLLPIVGALYLSWLINQPRIGPVGDGKPYTPTILQIIPFITTFIVGALTLPAAITRYVKELQKKNGEVD